MWRTVIVNWGEKLIIKNNWLVVYSDEDEHKIPVDDIYALVIENSAAQLSVCVITALTLAGAHLFFCDDKHIPVASAFSYNTHFKPLSVLKNQMTLSDEIKNKLWEK